MKLIAEAGGTKIDWVIVSEQPNVYFSSTGYNPLQNDSNYLRQILISSFPNNVYANNINEIDYFGTGCASQAGKINVEKALKHYFPNANIINIYSDLTAVGKAIFKHNSGIVGILGTGASIGFYSNDILETPVPSLGYLLGDEGSGAWLGKELLKKTIRKELPDNIILKLFKTYNTSQAQLIKDTYTTKLPAAYLASFVPFILNHIDNKDIKRIIESGFMKYTEHNIVPILEIYKSDEIGICGGVAFSFKDMLLKTISNFTNIKVTVLKTPLEGLL